MKQELLEYLVRTCVREVLKQSTIIKEANYQDDGYAWPRANETPAQAEKRKMIHFRNKQSPHNPSGNETAAEFEKRNKSKIQKMLHKQWPPIPDNMDESNQNLEEADDEIKGAAAPPADGQGTADQPEIPKETPEEPEDKEPQQPETPPSPSLKGVVLVNPRDKSKLQKVPLNAQADDIVLKKNLQRVASTIVGPNVKIADQVTRLVKDALRNQNSTVYLYLKKFDPNSGEIFLMADKSLQIAKNESVPSSDIASNPSVPFVPPSTVQPTTTPIQEPQTQQDPQAIREQQLKSVISKMVNEILDGNK